MSWRVDGYSDLAEQRDSLLSEWRTLYDAVPEDREVTVDEIGCLWFRGRGQKAHALRRMKERGLLTGGHGKFRRVAVPS